MQERSPVEQTVQKRAHKSKIMFLYNGYTRIAYDIFQICLGDSSFMFGQSRTFFSPITHRMHRFTQQKKTAGL